MAEQERKTKAERRARSRAERRRAEEESARRTQRQSVRNGVIAVAVIALIALVMIPAVSNWFGSSDDQVAISLEGALQARASAGCEMAVNGQPLPDSTHRDPSTAPPADVMYADATVRPTHSGAHFSRTVQALGGVPSDPLDERATTHNLEHGAVIAWFDPDTVEAGTVNEMEDWMQSRLDLGFESRAAGNVFVSPFPDMTGDTSIALRAWGYALNCQEWDQNVADSFLIDYWGTHGDAPESRMSPYPNGALGYQEPRSDLDATTDAPVETDSSPPSEDGEAASDDGRPTDS